MAAVSVASSSKLPEVFKWLRDKNTRMLSLRFQTDRKFTREDCSRGSAAIFDVFCSATLSLKISVGFEFADDILTHGSEEKKIYSQL